MFAKTSVCLLSIICVVKGEDKETKMRKVEELEKEKSDLFKQINTAIDESVKSLLKANDTEAILGLQYMRDLKEHIKEFNGTDVQTNEGINVGSKSDLENRRHLNDHFKKFGSDDPFDFEKVLKPKTISAKEWQEMVTNRQSMQQKLDLWISERQKEKERIKKLRLEREQMKLSGKYEICPRFGYRGRRRKESGRGRVRVRICPKGMTGKKCLEEASESEERRRRSEFHEKNKYPCCRKCCKKSYMGCL